MPVLQSLIALIFLVTTVDFFVGSFLFALSHSSICIFVSLLLTFCLDFFGPFMQEFFAILLLMRQ